MNKNDNLLVEIAKGENKLRYLITNDGIPIPEISLWLDLVSINSYLTGERYAYALLRYLSFLKSKNIDFREVQNKGTIEEYVKYLLGFREQIINIEAPLTFTAIQTNLTPIKQFYSWLEDEQVLLQSPLRSMAEGQKPSFNVHWKKKLLYGQIWSFNTEKTILSRIKYTKKHVHLKWYTENEIKKIIQHLPTIRDKVIFQISIETGMRIGEILGLKLVHFDSIEQTLQVAREQNTENKAKAKTEARTVVINNKLSDFIQDYLVNERGLIDVEYSPYLFLNYHGVYKGQPMRTRNFLRILKNAGGKAGIDKTKIRTHSGRSTRVQKLVELMRDYPHLGITQTYIDNEMGWRSEKTIKIYERGYTLKQKRHILEKINSITLNQDIPEEN
ncbi:tyrosine-type recombinase/integrase [Bacillus pseudomycoides]|uniref:tyrosine-type recombinase/integrase n=1 Tax=Bacillus pseudomycoides TaxID=64104 RepID=UPI000BFAAE80|nr:site-specific integrase [Bacillus pseudomycoides]PGE01472.1 integrase [Bacillus pseudomycoides]PHE69915.1 integrase [Bacillus pseudomycoides]